MRSRWGQNPATEVGRQGGKDAISTLIKFMAPEFNYDFRIDCAMKQGTEVAPEGTCY